MNERRKNMVIKVYESKFNDKLTSNYLSMKVISFQDKYIKQKI